MSIRIVTDSSTDLPTNLAEDLGITVVPLYVRFGNEIFRERVNITDDEFYRRLTAGGTVHPVTIQPSPQDFFEAYHRLSKQADAIISIHLSSKLSGTYNSAVLAKSMLTKDCSVEVIDSQSVSVGLGQVVLAAHKAIESGKNLDETLAVVNGAISNTRLLGMLDTLRYLLLGGRIGKAKALVGSMLGIKPILTLKDGEVVPAGQVRTHTKGLERLLDSIRSTHQLEDVAIAYSTNLDAAEKLSSEAGSIFTKKPIGLFRLGTTLGVHVGPGALIVSCRQGAHA